MLIQGSWEGKMEIKATNAEKRFVSIILIIFGYLFSLMLLVIGLHKDRFYLFLSIMFFIVICLHLKWHIEFFYSTTQSIVKGKLKYNQFELDKKELRRIEKESSDAIKEIINSKPKNIKGRNN